MRTWLVAVFLVSLPTCGFANDDPAAQQLLSEASRQVRIQAADKPPFQMEIDFQAQINFPLQGHITWKWANKDLWAWYVSLEDYQEIQVRNGEMVYTKRNAPFTPLALTHLQSMLNVADFDSGNWEIQKIKPEDGLACVQLKRHRGNYRRKICMEPDSKHVVSVEFKDSDDTDKQEFGSYQPFRDNVYPRELKYFEHGISQLQLRVVSLQDQTFEDSVFTPPQNSIVRRKCENMMPPIAVKQPDPQYPPAAAQNRLMGTTTVAFTVEANGSVSDIQIVQTAEHEMDRQTVETIKKWKFKPAMCGIEPVAADISVQVNFRLSR